MNNTSLVVQSSYSINPLKAEKEMTASLIPKTTISGTAVLYLKVPPRLRYW
jgi:hypothetical protein